MACNGVTVEEWLENTIRFYEEKGQTVVMASLDGESIFREHEYITRYTWYVVCVFISNTSIGVLVGAVVIHDKLKPEAHEAVKCLQSMGVKVALLTGDNRRTALAIADAVSALTNLQVYVRTLNYQIPGWNT